MIEVDETKLQQLLEIQGRHGNWNYSSYMRGLYNGMEVILASIEHRDPQYKDAPDRYIETKEENK